MILTFTQRLSASEKEPWCTLSLTAEERTRSRQPVVTDNGQAVYLHLPRGTMLREGDRLQASTGEIAHIRAKPEAVLTVTAQSPLQLLQAAYHLGNRHVAIEISETYLRLSPDPVLRNLLEHRGLQVVEELAPFQPEAGAYGHSHAH